MHRTADIAHASPVTASRRAAAPSRNLVRGHRPITVYGLALLVGYAVVAALIVGLGFLLVDVLVPIHAIGHSDEAVNVWLAQHRTGSLNEASDIGSSIGDVPVLPIVVALVVIVAAIRRHWRIVGLVLGAILVEVATYRVASLIVHRHRPYVVRLDHLPVNESFPSGHVAASVAIYASLALVVSWSVQRRWVVVSAWSIAILLPLLVAASRMYRGMHHPLDVTSGAIVGVLSITVALLATRAGAVAADERGAA
jgi:membrane-associated phospholipid phosphatase